MTTYLKKLIHIYRGHKQAIKYPLLVCAFWIIIKPEFDKILKNDIINNTTLSRITPNYFFDIVFIFAIIASVVYTLHTLSNKIRYGNKKIAWFALLFVIYCYYRFFEKAIWGLVPFKASILIPIKLADILILPFLTVAVNDFFLSRKKRKIAVHNNGFETDESIILQLDDKSGRFKFVLDLKKRIEETNNWENAFAIAINGKWGSGKTSFMKTLNEQLSSINDVITLFYNPWRVKDHRKIVESFFNELNLALSKFDKSLEDDIQIYVKSLPILLVANPKVTTNLLYSTNIWLVKVSNFAEIKIQKK